MLAKYEKRIYSGKEHIWAGIYINLHNLSHWHMDNEIIFVKKGTATVSVNGIINQLSENDCIFCQSGDLHYIKSTQDSMLYIILYERSLTEEITDSSVLKNPKLQRDYSIADLFLQIKSELKNKDKYYELRTNSLLMNTVVDIFRNEETLPNIKRADSTINNYKELLNHIDKTFDYISFSEAADFMGLSETYFSKLFKDICGMTFSQYLNNVRIEKAIEMLKSSERCPITEVATNCGYSSIRHFNRIFLQATGYSPKHLPLSFSLDVKPIKTVNDRFDPTLEESKLLKE